MHPTPDHPRISTRNASDPFSRATLGDLTQRQYAALVKAADLSPGLSFVVARYNERPDARGSASTHVLLYNEAEENVGLVGRDAVQYYDQNPATEQAVLRVAHRVYRLSVIRFN